MDSSDNNELFADDDDHSDMLEDQGPGDMPPPYVATPEFKQFIEDEQVKVHQKYGYMLIHTYKPFYFPGETIRGSIVLDIFNTLPKKSQKIFLRFTGQESVGQFHDEVNEMLQKQRRSSMVMRMSQISIRKLNTQTKDLDVIDEEMTARKTGEQTAKERILEKQMTLKHSVSEQVEQLATLYKDENKASLRMAKSHLGNIVKHQSKAGPDLFFDNGNQSASPLYRKSSQKLSDLNEAGGN